jgi:hypothetical protein
MDAVTRLELGMQTSPSPRGGLSPPVVAMSMNSKPECSRQQLDQLNVFLKHAVLRFFCRNVQGERKKSTRSCFSTSVDGINVIEAVKSVSENASRILDHVIDNYSAPSSSKEVSISVSLPTCPYIFIPLLTYVVGVVPHVHVHRYQSQPCPVDEECKYQITTYFTFKYCFQIALPFSS